MSDKYGPNGKGVRALISQINTLDEARMIQIGAAWSAARGQDEDLEDEIEPIFRANTRAAAQAAARNDADEALGRQMIRSRIWLREPHGARIEQAVRRAASLLVYRDKLGQARFARLFAFWGPPPS